MLNPRPPDSFFPTAIRLLNSCFIIIVSIVAAAFFFIYHMLPCKIAIFCTFLLYIFLFTLMAFCGQQMKHFNVQRNMFPYCAYDIKHFRNLEHSPGARSGFARFLFVILLCLFFSHHFSVHS